MSLEASPTLNLYIKQNSIIAQAIKSEPAKKRLDQNEIFKISALKLSPHPSFIFKRQVISKNLSNLKQQIQVRCETRAVVRRKSNVINESNGLMKSNRFNQKKSEDLDQTPNLNFFKTPQKLTSQSVKNLNFKSLGKNFLIRRKSGYWLKHGKNISLESFDAYHCSKYLSGEKTTSFYDMLEVFYESPTVFPYFNKSTKEYIKDEFSLQLKQRNNSLPASESQTILNKKLNNKKKKLQKKRTLIPVLETRFYNPQQVLFDKNVIVINFESINIGNSIVFRPGVVNELIQISGIYHIVIVSSQHGEEFTDILDKFERMNVKISAFYAVINQTYRNFKFLNYCEVFQDFNIDDPLESCLIISHHLIFDSVEEVEYIASVYGAKIKLNCEKVPVLFKKVSNAPMVVLIPSFTSGKSIELLKFVFSSTIINDYYTEELSQINFFKILKAKNCKIIASKTTQKVLTNFLTISPLVKESYSLDHVQYFIL